MKTTTSRKKKITNRRLILLAATLLFLQIVILMSLAFYQGFDLVSNRFSAATLDVLLLENQYDLTPVAERENIVPNKQVHKDPRVHNIEQTDAFVFLKITVPVVRATDVEADGTRTVKKAQELFRIKTERNKDYDNRLSDFNTYVDDNYYFWVELPECEEGTDLSGSVRTYVFGYSVYLKKDEYTETLFDYVQLKNIIQYESDPNTIQNIKVQAYGIQADHLGDIKKEISGRKAIMTEEQLTEIFTNYIENNNSQDGQGSDQFEP